MTFKNKWALITGASSGIGEGFAYALAKKGMHLVLVARREERLQILANNLQQKYQIKAVVIVLDLSQEDATTVLFNNLVKQNISINILINNAGFGLYGKFHETDYKKNAELINVNIFSVAMLTHLFLPAMVKAEEGLIINVASSAAFQPLPYMTNYAASKAFVLSFTESLWAEYRKEGISFLALCPGPVETEFFVNFGSRHNFGKKANVEEVVETALKAAAENKNYIIPGPWRVYILAQLSRFLPRKWALIIAEKILRPS